MHRGRWSRGSIARSRRRSSRRSGPVSCMSSRASSRRGSRTCRSRFRTCGSRIRPRKHTRIGWFRSVYNIPHAFGIQSFVSELAHAAGRDPKDFLLELIGRAAFRAAHHGEEHELRRGSGAVSDRYRPAAARVVETVARGAGWGRKLPKGTGSGIAAHRSFRVVHGGGVRGAGRCRRQDHGAASRHRDRLRPQVNPERVRSQLEGAVVMGLASRCTARSRSGRPSGAEQLQRLPGAAHERGAARNPRASCRAG